MRGLLVIGVLLALTTSTPTGVVEVVRVVHAQTELDTPTPTESDPAASTGEADKKECLAMTELSQWNQFELDKAGYDLKKDGYYFCSDAAPQRYQCNCASSSVCSPHEDPFGRNVGECTCCPVWIWIILGLLLLAVAIGLVFCLYACCCRGRWWCDGHPRAVQPILPRRGGPQVVPGSVPIPQRLFQGYRPADFETGLPPGSPRERQRRSSSGNNGQNPQGATRRRRNSNNRPGRSEGSSEEMSPLTVATSPRGATTAERSAFSVEEAGAMEPTTAVTLPRARPLRTGSAAGLGGAGAGGRGDIQVESASDVEGDVVVPNTRRSQSEEATRAVSEE